MQATRRIIQFGFLGLTIAAVFLLGANAERWCPFGGIEALYTYIHEGNFVCSLGVSNFYILGGILLTALLLRRVFCGYVCPIGALSEWLQGGARKLGIKPARIPAALDRVLSLLKYGVLAVILYFTWTLGELIFREFDPCYALISRHGEDITLWAYVVSGAIVVGSLFIMVPFCRWLCPMAAVLNPFSRFGLARIKRDAEPCIDCGKCAKVCPMAIPVDQALEVTHARCTSCLECVDACPEVEKGAITFGLPGRAGQPLVPFNGWSRAALAAVLLLTLTAAVSASYLFPLPSFQWSRGDAPAETVMLELKIKNLTCRGSSTLLVYYLERDDDLELPGFLALYAWPGPDFAEAHITCDPAVTDEMMIKMAITEPYFDYDTGIWRDSPFIIEGYDPLGLN